MKTTEPDPISEIEGVITELIRAVVRNPDGVKISHVEQGPLVAYVIKTDQPDVSRVLGKQGKHFKAMEVIVAEALRLIGRESHLVIDEKSPPLAPQSQKNFTFGTYNAKKFKSVKELLKRVATLYVRSPKDVDVITNDVGNTTLVELKINAADYPAIYGRDVAFEYGTDGHLLGAIKNFFDGIGKNNGRVIRIVVNKV
jgi:predicted RNA-binding protein YlqC (UPF0109 family)